MKEILFALYILSGLIKAVFLMYEYDPFIDITPVIAVLFLVVVSIELVRTNKIKEVIGWNRLKKTIPFAVFYLWILITLFYTPSEFYGYKKAFLFLTNVVAFAMPFLILNFKMSTFRNAFIVLSALLGLIFIIGYPDYPLQKASKLGIQNFRIFGSYYLSVAMFLGIALLLAIQIKDYRYRLITMSLLLFLLIGTAGRGPILFAALLLIIYFFKNLKNMLGKFRTDPSSAAKFSVALIILNATLYIAGTNIQHLAINFHRTAFRFGIMMRDPRLADLTMEESEDLDDMSGGNLSKDEKARRDRTNKNASILKRKEHYVYAFNSIFADAKSIIFGYGIGSYGIRKEGKDGRLYPHNLFLEIWYELGIIGMILFSVLMLWVLYRMFGVPLFLNLILIFILLNLQKSLSLVDLRVFFAFCSLILFYPVILNSPLPKFLRKHE